MKHILHDWPEKQCITILTNLRKAAGPNTKLIDLDSIIPYTCRDPELKATGGEDIPGAVPREAPSPLLANYGAVSQLSYTADMVVSVNAQNYFDPHADMAA
jgi:hypothetical protein